MECTLCQAGTTESGKVTVTLKRDGAIVLIKMFRHKYVTTAATIIFLKK